ncbi:MAG: STAS domain-containing protein [Candidatus Margulisbacteria bacterium]|nr:STAS domain-containing protein [Candidatus Margulisiibacteriota bacterium]
MRNIKTEDKGNTSFIFIEGDVEFDDSKKLTDTFEDILYHKKKNIALNLEDCHYIDFSGLGTLLRGQKESEKNQKQFSICSISDDCREIITPTYIYQKIKIFESMEEYVQCMN